MKHTALDPGTIDFGKGGGLVPVIVQDAASGKVLMQAFMDADALAVTQSSGRVTFFSRSKNRLWTKGESSGNYLEVKNILADCDRDCLLVLAEPSGPTCHTGTESCFDGEQGEAPPAPSFAATPAAAISQYTRSPFEFLAYLENLLSERRHADPETSYTARLLAGGPKRIAKKLGEEAVELALEAEHGEPERFREEAADLVYHLSVLLVSKGMGWKEVLEELEKRHKS
jgi:phosphoribosyl-AMP cyclohydrolase / phosphoribosyl-ATP pyrophosphohydrolase